MCINRISPLLKDSNCCIYTQDYTIHSVGHHLRAIGNLLLHMRDSYKTVKTLLRPTTNRYHLGYILAHLRRRLGAENDAEFKMRRRHKTENDIKIMIARLLKKKAWPVTPKVRLQQSYYHRARFKFNVRPAAPYI